MHLLFVIPREGSKAQLGTVLGIYQAELFILHVLSTLAVYHYLMATSSDTRKGGNLKGLCKYPGLHTLPYLTPK